VRPAPVWAKSRLPERITIPAADDATTAWIEWRMACSWRGPNEAQAATAAVPGAATAGHGEGDEINLAVRLFSSGPPSILHSNRVPVMHLDQ